MTCTFYHEGLKSCTVSYCYYPRNTTIVCDVKEQYLKEVGVIYRESPTDQPMTQQMQQRKYPKKY